MFKETRAKINTKYQNTKQWLADNRARVSLIAFVLGFIVDNFTLNRVDQLFDNFILLFYLFLASLCIFVVNRNRYKEITLPVARQFAVIAPFLTQYAFGALLSGYVIFYTKSASLAAAWPFLVVFYMFFLLNEKMGTWYQRTGFQITMLGAAYFSYLIFFIPVITKQYGFTQFAAAGFIGFAMIYWFAKAIKRFAHIGQGAFIRAIMGVIVVYATFFGLYITNVIPPIPLSLKKVEVYHDIGRTADGYAVTQEDYELSELLQRYQKVTTIRETGSIYVMTSVFAPHQMKADLVHVWQYQNPATKKYETRLETTFSIVGGRDGGYRWYSFYNQPAEGKWRFITRNTRGQEVGRTHFTVRYTNGYPDTVIKEI